MAFEGLQRLRVEHDGEVVRVWLNRPEKLNALDPQTLDEITAVYREVASIEDVRIVVLGGSGRAFSAGADLKDHPSRPAPDAPPRAHRYVAETGRRAIDTILACPAITLARVHSHVIGGGVLLAAACDFRIGADDTVFRLPEVELGLPLSWGGTPLLIKEIGAARAREMIMTARPFGAAESERLGLLHRAVPDADLDAEVDQWVSRLLAIPHYPLEATKHQFQRYAAAARLGDLSETDSDVYQHAVARTRLRPPGTP
ncbi:enoyl-CoA hydratase/isomerase family protein [Epidermidibacterium keratini]|uniref:Enoyl-CoA hydratase/isomerase family protein n=1 Tax=Epidermidibacterium keratini TaxID=1891644 RepID=A0A7L4YQZ0_9ACTN|nr:enoyl-CoA hydratase/isomerase family protein [Epidermidibacterium keratini]QHC01324.1 enoyl-CoA hydratase/isomerase family protein [Epidermidibacterium keratini]